VPQLQQQSPPVQLVGHTQLARELPFRECGECLSVDGAVLEGVCVAA